MDKDRRSRFAVSHALIASILILIIAISSLAVYLELSRQNASSGNTTSMSLPFEITINYTGSWNVVYWNNNGLTAQDNFTGSLITSGMTTTTISGVDYVELSGTGCYASIIDLYGVGHIVNGWAGIEETLCANATKLGSQNNLTLTLTVLVRYANTTAFNSSARVCATQAISYPA